MAITAVVGYILEATSDNEIIEYPVTVPTGLADQTAEIELILSNVPAPMRDGVRRVQRIGDSYQVTQ